MVDGKLIHGLSQWDILLFASGGHYEGTCPYHKDCLEGLAAGPSLGRRWGMAGAACLSLGRLMDKGFFPLYKRL